MMRTNRASVFLSPSGGCYQADDLRRRVAGCRDRLRRNRASRRIAGRDAPGAAESLAEALEAKAASDVREARREKG